MVVALIGGGSRSGKSRYALEFAESRYERPALIATAQALDPEMSERIERHRAERSAKWHTIEEPFALAEAMERERSRFDVFVVDCLTLWLSNVMLQAEPPAEREIDSLVEALATAPHCILVTNEVGCGIVPENELARRFRDLAGILNRRVATIAREVHWMVFGIPLRIKNP